jgi:hypothetical protein
LIREGFFFCNDVELMDHYTELAEKVRELLISAIPEDMHPGPFSI